MFTAIPSARTSTAVEAINANPFTKVVNLRFTNGYEYKYSNVSRAKIVNLLINPNMSFGFWVQDLVNQSVRENRYNVQTGRLTYRECGFSPYTNRYINF